jgi:hypothetical protein
LRIVWNPLVILFHVREAYHGSRCVLVRRHLAVEHDLRHAGPDLFVQYWESLRDTLQKLERDFGPSDNWK